MRIQFWGGDPDIIYDTARDDVHLYAEGGRADDVHEELGGELFYRSRSGLSGAGWIPRRGRLQVHGAYRTDTVHPLFSDADRQRHLPSGIKGIWWPYDRQRNALDAANWPVVIRDQHGYVLVHSDILRHYLAGTVSPTTASIDVIASISADTSPVSYRRVGSIRWGAAVAILRALGVIRPAQIDERRTDDLRTRVGIVDRIQPHILLAYRGAVYAALDRGLCDDATDLAPCTEFVRRHRQHRVPWPITERGFVCHTEEDPRTGVCTTYVGHPWAYGLKVHAGANPTPRQVAWEILDDERLSVRYSLTWATAVLVWHYAPDRAQELIAGENVAHSVTLEAPDWIDDYIQPEPFLHGLSEEQARAKLRETLFRSVWAAVADCPNPPHNKWLVLYRDGQIEARATKPPADAPLRFAIAPESDRHVQ